MNLPQQTVVVLDLLWVHCGVFSQSLVVATVGLLLVPLTRASISISNIRFLRQAVKWFLTLMRSVRFVLTDVLRDDCQDN